VKDNHRESRQKSIKELKTNNAIYKKKIAEEKHVARKIAKEEREKEKEKKAQEQAQKKQQKEEK
jgi:hypothetical protein